MSEEKKEKKKAGKKTETMRCDYCKRDVFLCKRCGVCKKAQYCSPMCQKDDWSEVRRKRRGGGGENEKRWKRFDGRWFAGAQG